MNKDLMREIEIPEGVTVEVSGNRVTVKGNGKEVVREFDNGKVSMEVKDGKFVLVAKGATRRESKMIGTIWAHLKNMIKGVAEDTTKVALEEMSRAEIKLVTTKDVLEGRI